MAASSAPTGSCACHLSNSSIVTSCSREHCALLAGGDLAAPGGSTLQSKGSPGCTPSSCDMTVQIEAAAQPPVSGQGSCESAGCPFLPRPLWAMIIRHALSDAPYRAVLTTAARLLAVSRHVRWEHSSTSSYLCH